MKSKLRVGVAILLLFLSGCAGVVPKTSDKPIQNVPEQVKSPYWDQSGMVLTWKGCQSLGDVLGRFKDTGNLDVNIKKLPFPVLYLLSERMTSVRFSSKDGDWIARDFWVECVWSNGQIPRLLYKQI